MDRIALDILGPLPVTSNGNEYLLVVGEYFAKFSDTYAIPNPTALTVVDKLVNEFIARYGVPSIINSDQGREFDSHLFSEMCKLLNIQEIRITPYNPKFDGMIERLHRLVLQMLSMLVNEIKDNWDDHNYSVRYDS